MLHNMGRRSYNIFLDFFFNVIVWSHFFDEPIGQAQTSSISEPFDSIVTPTDR